VSEIFATLISEEVITLKNIGAELLTAFRRSARQMLGLPAPAPAPQTNGHTGLTSVELRARGMQLLFESARVDHDDDTPRAQPLPGPRSAARRG
jgi:hypothetical protein